MALPATETILALLNNPSKKPQLILEVEGWPVVSSIPSQVYAYYDQTGIAYDDPGLLYDGLAEDKDALSYIDLARSTNNITQQLLIDKGGYSSTTNFDIAIVDKNQLITKLITPGLILDDTLGKKAWVYLSLEGAGHPEDSILFFSGIVSDIKSGAGYVNINVSSPEKLKSSEIFPKVSTALTAIISNVDTTIPVVSTDGFIANSDGTTIQSYIQIGDELIKVGGFTATSFTGCTRAQFGTIALGYAINENVESFYRIQGNLRDLSLKLMLSGGQEYFIENEPVIAFNNYGLVSVPNAIFISEYYPDQKFGVVAGDIVSITGAINAGNNGLTTIQSIATNSLGSYLILNKTLINEGSGAFVSIKSKYNVLPKFAGLEMTPEQVDVAEFERIYTQFSSQFFEYDFYVKEQVNGSEFINSQILYPSGCYSLPRKAKTSIGLTVPPLAVYGTKKLTNLNVTKASNIKINRSISKNFYNAVVYKYDKDAVEDKYLRGKITQSADSTNRIKVSNKVLTIESDGIRTSGNFDYLFQTQTTRFLQRYQFGAESFDVQVMFGVGFNIEIGDTVIFDGAGLNVSDTKDINGTRDFLPRLFEVQNKSMSLKGTDITLTLVDTVYSLAGRYGVIAPSSIVGTGSTTTKVILNRSYGDLLSDRFSTAKWSNYIGESILFRSEDWSYQEIVKITAIDPANPNAIIVSPALSLAPASGIIADTPRYPMSLPDSVRPEVNAIYKATHCFYNNTYPVLTGSTTTQLVFQAANAAYFKKGFTVKVHSDNYSVQSKEIKIIDVFLSSVLPSYVTLESALSFTPLLAHKIELLGYEDNGSPYRYV